MKQSDAKVRPHYLGKSKMEPIAIGSKVIVERPNMWAGYKGVVKTFNPKTGIHVVSVASKAILRNFDIEAIAENLRVVGANDQAKEGGT